MPHIDAVGYIENLRNEIDKPWFSLLCQKALIDGLTTLDNAGLDEVYSVLTGQSAYQGYPVTGAAAAIVPPASSVDFLESLTGFSNFKKLAPTMGIAFAKPISLIFGTNGSGKSSLCDALKVLSTGTAPERPLENVRANPPALPVFTFKFRSDGSAQTWQRSNGYGLRQHQVKHFDTAVAIGILQNSVEPGRVVELLPFKLHLFEVLKSMLAALREKMQSAKQVNDRSISVALEDIRRTFDAFDGFPLRTVAEGSIEILDSEIAKGLDYDNESLKTHLANEVELVKGTSEEGLRLLKAEYSELETLSQSLGKFISSIDKFWKADIVDLAAKLADKEKEQAVVGKTLIPHGATLNQLLALIRPASEICTLDAADGKDCPLCRQNLGPTELELFKKYHALLNSTLEQDIQKLRSDITIATSLHDGLQPFRDLSWVKGVSVDDSFLAAIRENAEHALSESTLLLRPTENGRNALVRLQSAADGLAAIIASKQQTISTATNDRSSLLEQLRILRIEIQRLEYVKLIVLKLETLKEVKSKIDSKGFFDLTLASFTSIARKLTEAAKTAYDELVIADFKTRLEQEYLALTEQTMDSFGVKLVPRGSDASVTLLPQIGGKEIRSILSEGEQRIHALALFFAELETCKHSVIVFDDPVSSFDYNYVGNFCIRLRNWHKAHPDKQIIILTHSWEFFVQLQSILNKENLGPSLSVMVLESCSVVGDYSEKISELKADITAFLSSPSEPSKSEKEVAAGRMRRLIEAIVNAHVFNHQRSQFKQKTLSDSVFQHYTKLVPLLDSEATILRDLYGKLSISEHDDPRNAYVNQLLSVFQTRYDQIVLVETAILARK